MVWDSHDKASGWSDIASWTMPKHAYPVVNFNLDPTSNIRAQSNIRFLSTVIFYDTPSLTKTWLWNFGDQTPSISGSSYYDSYGLHYPPEQNPIHKFSREGQFDIQLNLTDGDGYSCPIAGSLTLGPANPIWKEIPPKQ